MRLRLSLIAISVLIFEAPIETSHAYSVQDLADAVLTSFEISDPPLPCNVPDIAGWVGAQAGIPIGVEYIPGECDSSARGSASGRRSLAGWTVRRALDLLLDADPRYAWSIVDGGVTFRPIAAIRDPNHFLHTSVGNIGFRDMNVDGAFAALMQMLGIKFYPRPMTQTPQEALQFSVPSQTASVLKALELLVRQHGAMRWEVRYCRPQSSRQFASIGLYTFDKGGLVFQLDQSFRSRGEPNPCRKQ